MIWRHASEADVPAIVALLRDDMLGEAREGHDLAPYVSAFHAIAAEPATHLIVGDVDGRIVATYHLTVLTGLSLSAARRAQLEGVRVAGDQRSRGIGAALVADAERRAREAGCRLMQLTSNAGRTRALAFYERLGYAASHVGFKKPL